MDEKYLEMAGALSEADVTHGLQKARSSSPKPEGFDGTCKCGEDIPQLRIDHGFYTCVECKAREERAAHRRRL